jgi:glycerol kinase
MSCLLGIDQSTSATKVLLFDLEANAIDAESIAHQQHYPHPGWVEHDAEEIWRNLLEAARRLLARHAALAREVRGISITNQRETVVVFDQRTAMPLVPAIVWQCRRSDLICRELLEAGHEAAIEETTGLRLDAYFSASKLAWLMREKPDLREALCSGAALAGTIDTYLVYRLTGGQVFATDHTNASRTLLFNLRRRTWDGQLCELFDVPQRSLADVRESFAQFGETNVEGLLPNKVPIHGVMGDSQASLFAQCCFEPGQTKATFGTGTSVMMNIGQECVPASGGMVAALAWVLCGKPTYALEGLINYSAATIAWLKDQLGLLDTAADSERIARQVCSSEGVYLIPAFSGMGAPYWRPNARAAIVGMTAYTTKQHIVRAALESIAYQVYDVINAMNAAGVTPTLIQADGGPTRNALLMQMVADTTRLEVVTRKATDSSARGAAMAALLGLGLVESLSGLRTLASDGESYRPLMDATLANTHLAGWHAALEQVL